MSSFTPRSWKSRTEAQAEPRAEPAVEQALPHDAVKSNNLPIPSTPFIGRERDVAEVKKLLEHHRLVTLVGSGGVGKTRLAIRAGTELLEGYPDGAWFVDLAPIADAELVSSVVAQTLGIDQQQGHRVDESIPPWLERKRMLLIFDNCEHVLETIAPIAASILRTAPDVRIVATSRQALELGGEAVVRVPSMDVQQAVALFASRAALADRSFTLTDDTASIVGDICRRLDGIPLAIELAAARVKVLSIPHLAERLKERFKLLTGGSRDALPRQKTLQALLDWSHDLLTEQEQLLFARLGIFAGGFALDAATSVCGGERLDELDILDLLGSLTDKSLVAADTTGERERYRLLESTAAYALEKLHALREHAALARRHARHFCEQAEAAAERFGNGSTVAWLTSVEVELDNYRNALTWALTQGNDGVAGGAIAGALHRLWTNAGLAVEGRYWVERALEVVDAAEHPRIAARLHYALSSFVSGPRSRDANARAMELYEAAGDARGAARAQAVLAFALVRMGTFDAARAEIEKALTALRACEDGWGVATALNVQAIIAQSQGDFSTGRICFGQALAAYKALGNESGTAVVLYNLAEFEFADGRPDHALIALGEAIETGRRAMSAEVVAGTYTNSAAYRLALGDLAGARESALEGLQLGRRGRIQMVVAIALQHLAVLAGLSGDGRRAAALLGYVDTRYRELGIRRELTERRGYDELLVTLREVLNEDEIAQLAAEGATWSEDRAVEEAFLV